MLGRDPTIISGACKMRRAEKSTEVKKNMMDAALDLFLAQGYRKTTIRQIAEKAQVNIGTLYHFFRDKEDLHLQIGRDVYNEFMEYADNLIRKKKDPALRYALTRALELKEVEDSDRVAELYLESYSSWRITQMVLPVNIQRNKLLFQEYNPDFTEQDYLNRTLALRGMRLMFILDRVKNGPGNFNNRCPFLIETALKLFNVPKENIDKAVPKAVGFVKKNRSRIHRILI
jgi:AcrR family transcriptional regulator